MRKEYEQCLHYTGVDLLNNEDSGVLRSVVCPFTSETDCVYEIFNPFQKKMEGHALKEVTDHSIQLLRLI